MQPKHYMLRVAAKRGLLTALLTAIIVFCSALVANIEHGRISWLVFVSALLMAAIAFCQKLLELRESGRKKGSSG